MNASIFYAGRRRGSNHSQDTGYPDTGFCNSFQLFQANARLDMMTSSIHDLCKSLFPDLAMRRYTLEVSGNSAAGALVLTRTSSVPAEVHASSFNSMALNYYAPAARVVLSCIQIISIYSNNVPCSVKIVNLTLTQIIRTDTRVQQNFPVLSGQEPSVLLNRRI
jgi:hypothetical protein